MFMERFFISTSEKPPVTAMVYALGTFDGVHLGHMQLMREAIKLAHERGLKPACIHSMSIRCSVTLPRSAAAYIPG